MRVMEMIAHYESSREDTLQDDYTSGGGVEGGGEDEEMAGILKLKVLPRRLAEILAKTEPLIQVWTLTQFVYICLCLKKIHYTHYVL